MATPCDPELAQAPFQTHRDPITGEWSVKKNRIMSERQPLHQGSNVISLKMKLEEKKAI